MPKECIHWIVARRTADLLRGGEFEPALKSARAALLLGAVAHDALFYLSPARQRRLGDLQDVLHGVEGEDTYALPRMLLEELRENGPIRPTELVSAKIAFLTGLVTHIHADAALHPLVYHHSGNYYAPRPEDRTRAVQSHRALETVMDLAAVSGPVELRETTLFGLVRDLGGFSAAARLLPAARLAVTAGTAPEELLRQYTLALRVFAVFRTLTTCAPLADLLYVLRRALPAPLREIAALFYSSGLRRRVSLASGPIVYALPTEGSLCSATLDGLMDRAANCAADVLRGWEGALFRGEELPAAASGPSLDTGRVGTPVRASRHFAPRPLVPF